MEPMEAPGPVLAVIAAAGLIAIGGAFYLSYVAAHEPPAPPGVVSTPPPAPSAQAPAQPAPGDGG